MRKIICVILSLALLTGCDKKEKSLYSTYRHDEYQYNIADSVVIKGINDDVWTTWEMYMWYKGFPESIIIEDTASDGTVRYSRVERRGVVRDSLGNTLGPAYCIIGNDGYIVKYNLKGEFVALIPPGVDD